MDNPTQTLLTIFVGIAALSILLQAGFTIGTFVAVRKAQKKIVGLAEDVRLHALPAIISSRDLIQDLTPKIRTMADNISAVSTTLRGRTDEVGGMVGDVTGRAQAQAARVDGMVKGTLDQLNVAVHAIEHGVSVPLRQVNGILNGFRAGVEVLRKKTPSDAVEQEDDLFV
jgi:hypothetical protein